MPFAAHELAKRISGAKTNPYTVGQGGVTGRAAQIVGLADDAHSGR